MFDRLVQGAKGIKTLEDLLAQRDKELEEWAEAGRTTVMSVHDNAVRGMLIDSLEREIAKQMKKNFNALAESEAWENEYDIRETIFQLQRRG